jgi:hypothetical protein
MWTAAGFLLNMRAFVFLLSWRTGTSASTAAMIALIVLRIVDPQQRTGCSSGLLWDRTRVSGRWRACLSLYLSLSFGLLDRRLPEASHYACAQQDIWVIRHVSLSPVIYGHFLLARQPITNRVSFSCRSVHICSVSPKKAGAPFGFPTRARSLPTRDPRPAQH